MQGTLELGPKSVCYVYLTPPRRLQSPPSDKGNQYFDRATRGGQLAPTCSGRQQVTWLDPPIGNRRDSGEVEEGGKQGDSGRYLEAIFSGIQSPNFGEGGHQQCEYLKFPDKTWKIEKTQKRESLSWKDVVQLI